MNEIERTKRQRELEADYMKACSLAHDQSRDGLAQHLYAAQAQYALAELAASPEVREMHLNLAQHHRTFVAERKRMLAASAALNGSEAASAGQKKEDTARVVPATGKKPDDELRGFDPENCRVKGVPPSPLLISPAAATPSRPWKRPSATTRSCSSTAASPRWRPWPPSPIIT